MCRSDSNCTFAAVSPGPDSEKVSARRGKRLTTSDGFALIESSAHCICKMEDVNQQFLDNEPRHSRPSVDLNPQAVVRVLVGISVVLVLAVVAAVYFLVTTRDSIDVATVRQLSGWQREMSSRWTLSVFLHEQEVDLDRQVWSDCCAQKPAAFFSSAQRCVLLPPTP